MFARLFHSCVEHLICLRKCLVPLLDVEYSADYGAAGARKDTKDRGRSSGEQSWIYLIVVAQIRLYPESSRCDL